MLVISYFHLEVNKASPGWRKPFLWSALIGAVILLFLTESLSLFQALTPFYLAGGWGIAVLFAAGLVIRKIRAGAHFSLADLRPGRNLATFFVAILLFQAALLALTGWLSPPNNWDGLVYHLPRVIFWMDHQSVAYYPANTLRQLYQPPFAEYAILNLQILSQSDRFAFLPQWLSMAGSLIGTSLIAKNLGGSRNAEILAAVLTATIPMGILQATSTQNDYVVGFGLVCFVYFCLESYDALTWGSVLAVGAALGLAILTKATAYLFAAPFLLWWCFVMARKYKLQAIKGFLLVGFLVILINLGQIARSLDLFGNPIGLLDPARVGEVEYANKLFTLPALISNLLRNLSIHLGTNIPLVDRATDLLLYYVHNFLDVDLSDPRTTFQGLKFTMSSLNYHEDGAGNIIHLLLMAVTLGMTIGSRIFRKSRRLVIYLVLLIAGFVFFCCYLRWQPFNSRLHLPWFLLWSPFLAVNLANLVKDRSISLALIGCALLFLSYPWFTRNYLKPLFGPDSIFLRPREDQYFMNAPYYQHDYVKAVSLVRQNSCAQVGLYLPGEWEYPLWALLHEQSSQTFRLKDVNVRNVSSRYTVPADFTPCAIIAMQAAAKAEDLFDGQPYRKIWSSDYLSVSLKK